MGDISNYEQVDNFLIVDHAHVVQLYGYINGIGQVNGDPLDQCILDLHEQPQDWCIILLQIIKLFLKVCFIPPTCLQTAKKVLSWIGKASKLTPID